MTQRIWSVVVALLVLAVTVPVQGKNYLLHSPKLWSPQEKEQYERENSPVKNEKEPVEIEKHKEQLKKDKELAERHKEQAKKDKELVEKQKEQLKKDRELVERQKEQAKKDMELVERQKEQAKKDKELAERQKEQAKKDKELAERQKEQTKKHKELAEKQKEQVKKDKELAEKQRDQFRNDKEYLEKQKEHLKKEMGQAEKQTEQVKKEKEQVAKLREQVKKDKEHIKKEKEEIKKEKARIRKNQILVKDGVSFREVTVQKGDTLYSISRKYSNQGATYAATLRFNNIDDPDQIVDGDIINVPLFQEKKAQQPAPVTQLKSIAVVPSQSYVKRPEAEKSKTRFEQELSFVSQPAVKEALSLPAVQAPPVSVLVVTPQQQTSSNNLTIGQELFEQAVKSYRSGDCQTSIQLFGRFLAEHTGSVLAADASLFVADCYLKLSTK